MTRSWKRHSPEEIVTKLKTAAGLEAKGAPVAEAASSIGVGLATYYRWRRHYSGLQARQVLYIWKLETEVARLRKAIRDLENGVEIAQIVSPPTPDEEDEDRPRGAYARL